MRVPVTMARTDRVDDAAAPRAGRSARYSGELTRVFQCTVIGKPHGTPHANEAQHRVKKDGAGQVAVSERIYESAGTPRDRRSHCERS